MRVFSLALICVFFFSCNHADLLSIKIENTTSQDRASEMIEVSLNEIYDQLHVDNFNGLRVVDAQGNPTDSQLTYDGKLIFLADVPGTSTSTYKIVKGNPQSMDTLVVGRQYPERLDDIAWENDVIAFRAYGPAFQKNGNLGFGYDVWVKSVSYPVVEERYRKDLQESISYHVDHGDGLDCYSVGPTLGAGANALLKEGEIVYPKSYASYEILDNGPLRFSLRLTFHPVTLETEESWIEHREITLDAGSFLNHTSVFYENLKETSDVLAGIVMHHPNHDSYTIAEDKGYIAYADPTEDSSGKSGEIFIGLSFPNEIVKAEVRALTEKEKQTVGSGIVGHLVGVDTLEPEGRFNYYWGAAWSKANFKDLNAWSNYLKQFTEQKRNPLKVTLSLPQ